MTLSNKANLPTKFGNFIVQSVRKKDAECADHLIVMTQNLGAIPLVRVHSECLTGDVFGSKKCDCGDELAIALEKIAKHGGMVIYLRQEGRGIGLFNKINAYHLQDGGLDTIEANRALGFAEDTRDYALVGEIFGHFGIKKVRLLTNNPHKIREISRFAEVVREEIHATPNDCNRDYLRVKREKLGHML